ARRGPGRATASATRTVAAAPGPRSPRPQRHVHHRRRPPTYLRPSGEPGRNGGEHPRTLVETTHQLPHHGPDPQVEPDTDAKTSGRRPGWRPGLDGGLPLGDARLRTRPDRPDHSKERTGALGPHR